MEKPFTIKIEGDDKITPPKDFKEEIASMKDQMDDFKEYFHLAAEMKWTQYHELVKHGFTKPQALTLIKDGLKM